MRSAILFAPALLAGCSTAPAATPSVPVHGVTPGHICSTADTARFIGQIRSDRLGAAITGASHAAVLRWAPPGVMLTMDYRADRVTVRVDPSGKVTQIRCG
jgi:hypothetical protein